MVTNELLFDYFAGRATEAQKAQVQAYLHDPAHVEAFYAALDDYERRFPQYVPDLDDPLRRYLTRLEPVAGLAEAPDEPTSEPALPLWRRPWRWGIAASVALLLVGGWLFRDELRYQTHATGYGETRLVRLDDGTRVTLNANSRLRVPRWGFRTRERQVVLSGEAEFAVEHLPDNRNFVVKTDRDFDIEVLGTVFSVFTRDRGKKVVLNQGKVRIHYQTGSDQRLLTMKPGDLVTMDPGGQIRLSQTLQPQQHTAWKFHRFVFDDTPLTEVCQMVTETFGTAVRVPDERLASRRLSGTFSARTADDLLAVVSELLDARPVRQRGNAVELVPTD
jgi:ferric-dicitrate binding protein FerR (iron transport regulator)